MEPIGHQARSAAATVTHHMADECRVSVDGWHWLGGMLRAWQGTDWRWPSRSRWPSSNAPNSPPHSAIYSTSPDATGKGVGNPPDTGPQPRRPEPVATGPQGC